MASTHSEPWYSGPRERPETQRYVHLIRSDDDPERSPREEHRGEEMAWRKKLGKGTETIWRQKIIEHMLDKKPRTFNRIVVELGDTTADVAFEMGPDRALWSLVDDGVLEHTGVAPIYFRWCERHQYERFGDFEKGELVFAGEREKLGIILWFVITTKGVQRVLLHFDAIGDETAYDQYHDLEKLKKI